MLLLGWIYFAVSFFLVFFNYLFTFKYYLKVPSFICKVVVTYVVNGILLSSGLKGGIPNEILTANQVSCELHMIVRRFQCMGFCRKLEALVYQSGLSDAHKANIAAREIITKPLIPSIARAMTMASF